MKGWPSKNITQRILTKNLLLVLQVKRDGRRGGEMGNIMKKYRNQFLFSSLGRPGGPEFYVNIVDNTRNHGPGSQVFSFKIISRLVLCLC